MYAIVQRSYPRKSADKYRRPVRVLVVDATAGIKGCYRRGDPTVIREWADVDSRYSGPRSEYGQAIRAARALVEQLNGSTAVTA